MSKSKRESLNRILCRLATVSVCVFVGFLFILVFLLHYFESYASSTTYHIAHRLGHSYSSFVHNDKVGKRVQGMLYENQSSLFMVFASDGITITSSGEHRPGKMNAGSLLIGKVADLNQSREISGNSCELLLQISFPYRGWICMNDGKKPMVKRISFLKSSSENDTTRQGGSQIFEDIDLPGGDIPDSPIPALSPNACQMICNQNIICNAWTFTPDSSCWLKRFNIKIIASVKKPKKGLTSGFSTVNKFDPRTMQYNKLPHCCDQSVNLQDDVISFDNFINGAENTDLNSWIIRLRKNNGWNEQFPIGNGKFGSLVGGALSNEAMPLSVSGLYFRRKKNASPVESSSKYKAFMETRNLLLSGNLSDAHRRVAEMIDSTSNFGMFQYFADITIAIHNTMIFKNSEENIPANRGSRIFIARNHMLPTTPSRQVLFDTIADKINTTNNLFQSTSVVSFSSLNMREGTVEAQIIEKLSLGGDSVYRLHHREWFASEVDDVILGKFSVQQFLIDDQPTVSIERISIALRLSRDHNMNMDHPSFEVNISIENPPDAKFHIVLKSNENIDVPFTLFCGVLRCKRLSEVSQIEHDQDLVICNDVSSAEIYISSIQLDSPSDSMHERETVERCFDKVSRVVSIGFDEAKLRHSKLFSSRMSRVKFDMTSSNESTTCSLSSLANRLSSFNIGCRDKKKSASTAIQSKDITLIPHSYQYGRYLSLSSASRSVPNLQGIWADGPVSAWNGDYHMNINIQQMFWPVGVANLEETISPLISFLKRLSSEERGHAIAKDLYGCNSPTSWVAHGFVDNTLNAGILGDAKWALCVTCGAWVAVTVFDALLFSNNNDLLIDSIIPVLRGVAEFFLEYMVIVDGVAHTGPTTSPENSYRYVSKTDSINSSPIFSQSIGVLTMSSAIDCSILRQASNAYSLALGWIKEDSLLNQKYTEYMMNHYEDDVKLSERFRYLVQKMPGGAMPVIGRHGRVLEYPYSPPNTLIGEDYVLDVFSSSKYSRQIDESIDHGHRHFSGMHWLYPNTFQTTNPKEKELLFNAAANTLTTKRVHGGGHTSWSAAWEACLYARLSDGESAMQSITRILTKYSSSNLLSMHPPLAPSGEIEACETCFSEIMTPDNIDSVPSQQRGMTTQSDAKFQLDGNLGIVAAINEMLIQSHEMGVIRLLPGMSSEMLSFSGHIDGLKCRGSVTASISWKRGSFDVARLYFPDYHPWLGSYHEVSSGFFSYTPLTSVDSKNANIVISSHNRIAADRNNGCYHWSYVDSNFKSIRFEIVSYPCALLVCNAAIHIDECLHSATIFDSN